MKLHKKNKLQNMHVSVMKVNKELFELLSTSLIFPNLEFHRDLLQPVYIRNIFKGTFDFVL